MQNHEEHLTWKRFADSRNWILTNAFKGKFKVTVLITAKLNDIFKYKLFNDLSIYWAREKYCEYFDMVGEQNIHYSAEVYPNISALVKLARKLVT